MRDGCPAVVVGVLPDCLYPLGQAPAGWDVGESQVYILAKSVAFCCQGGDSVLESTRRERTLWTMAQSDQGLRER